ncbi:hypothetical protein [Nocardioides nitrophenolicus]|uniref:hypothetical protein n=1 Tax=Nocardioides nitrophenolicus TaxID=60489 RepID=UPI00195E239D|nr:hypothetical protein [Nocardioides nitrophenolicus]MBM7516062.1 hypothetical protein [Nocardioides nitrophenolicus]
MRRTNVVSFRSAAAGLAAVALLTAGCGVSDNEVKPGVAAEVEGQRLSLSKVDQAVEDYCALRAANPQAQPAPTALIRAQFVVGWTQAVAVDELAPEHGIALPVEQIDRTAVHDAWDALGVIDDDNYDTFEFLTWIQQRLSDPVAELGAADSGAQGDAAVSAGIALITDWLDQHDVTFNPVFGSYDAQTGAFDGDPLSVPVSAEATSAADTGALTAAQVAALPADQRCGPAVDPAAAAPAG